MKITKGAVTYKTGRIMPYYYNQAREGMHDVIYNMYSQGLIDTVLLPGYIGWSPKEGSGIFDSISSITGLNIVYYKMNNKLFIDKKDLFNKINSPLSLVLLVNFFGFRDLEFDEIVDFLKEKSIWIMEDNAHGFFTWHVNRPEKTDIVVFSLHKMFPFSYGAGVFLQNERLSNLKLAGSKTSPEDINPYSYNLYEIAMVRKDNYLRLYKELMKAEEIGVLNTLRPVYLLEKNVPQTYPIVLKIGNRDKVYQMMNEAGFGVVSLYHTLIEPLQNGEFNESLELSKHILNLPVHQDVDNSKYAEMVEYLIHCCNKTRGNLND